ncbi:nitrite reductase small subunit NirD [Pseudomonas sp. KNUC1026]|uniref:nitrite reductase small subunit NirD n=1 Tax=Pseudomonas sp. KNUC1026 TaxID=2893890 RepID=UPI001F33DDC9|nr:nitrite reductase small subunit NirD [Pseudomonas sp. KNUC1026]UFH48305.1 nitrite reductase small subunit NirD [Pseudomonas sp. KNUC1026]
MNGAHAMPNESGAGWLKLCGRDDLVAHSGVVALLGGTQIALFYLPGEQGDERVFALENRDPRSGANVIGRGLVGSLAGKLVVAAPLYKQRFGLEDGVCVEAPDERLRVWPARLRGDDVEVNVA